MTAETKFDLMKLFAAVKKTNNKKPGLPGGKNKMKKQTIINSLRQFIAQRSGIDYRNYGNRESFMADYRPILRAGRDAKILLAAVSARDSLTDQDLVDASNSAFSGRLQFVEKGDSVTVDYTAGQYFAVEYRKAACAVIATALWQYARSSGYETSNEIRKWARQEFGRGIANRWFN